MPSTQLIRYLLWDFGDTLAAWRGDDPKLLELYKSTFWREKVDPEWQVGKIPTNEAIKIYAEWLKLSETEVMAYLMREDLFEFFPFTHSFFNCRHLPQSVVTTNPALFRQLATKLGLAAVTDTMIISGEEGTTDKGALCETALKRIDRTYRNEQVLLIDNKQSNLDAWTARGGRSYLFTDDAAFKHDVRNGIDGLVA